MSSQQAVVEPATAGDVDRLVDLMEGYCAFYRFPSPGTEALKMMALTEIAADDNDGMMIVARVPDAPGGVAGFVHVTWKMALLQANRIAIMEDLFVDPDFRGRGCGRLLVDAAIDRARELGSPVLQWVTQTTNVTAQSLYDRTGAYSEAWLEYELEL